MRDDEGVVFDRADHLGWLADCFCGCMYLGKCGHREVMRSACTCPYAQKHKVSRWSKHIRACTQKCIDIDAYNIPSYICILCMHVSCRLICTCCIYMCLHGHVYVMYPRIPKKNIFHTICICTRALGAGIRSWLIDVSLWARHLHLVIVNFGLCERQMPRGCSVDLGCRRARKTQHR